MGLLKSLRARYSLRALLVCVTLFCLWGGFHANRGWRERQAVAVLERHGAVVKRRGIYEGYPLLVQLSVYYRQLVQVFWREPFIHAVGISSALEPEVVEAVAQLPHLETLKLISPNCGPFHGQYVRPFHCPQREMPAGAMQRMLSGNQLTDLDLDHWILSEEDVAAIANHTHLCVLNLDSVSLPDNGLAKLVAMPRLQRLWLNHCQAKDLGSSDAPASMSLTSIICKETPVGSEFGDFIGRSPCIETLSLAGLTIDDGFVVAIGAHPNLRAIGLSRTAITDKSLTLFKEMPALKMIGLPSSLYGHPAVMQLKSTKPDLMIHVEYY